MELTQGMALQQVLSPQMQQSLHILQVPLMELRQMVATEMQENPVLEEVASGPGTDESVEKPAAESSALNDEWNEYFVQRASAEPWTAEARERREHFLNSQTKPVTLQHHLLEQVGGAGLTVRERGIALAVIGNVNDRGYLEDSDEAIAAQAGCAVAEAAKVLEIVQTFDPPGVAARTLSECLLLQLQRSGRGYGLASRIVRHYLEELGRRKLPEIARRVHEPVEAVQRAAEVIAGLEPRPGRPFSAEDERTILPDVIVERDGDGYAVSLNNDDMPALRVGGEYKDMLSESSGDPEVRGYLRDKIRSGRFLIKCIEQRKQTLRSTAREIVERQQDFFDRGPAHLHPMTMGQVAGAVGVHETTISRAVSGKYMATPRGLLEMKYFFTAGYTNADGTSVSNESVRQAIAEIVRGEQARRPLSDQDIVALLSERGLPIARRTVAKYREQLGIAPSHLRKTY